MDANPSNDSDYDGDTEPEMMEKQLSQAHCNTAGDNSKNKDNTSEIEGHLLPSFIVTNTVSAEHESAPSPVPGDGTRPDDITMLSIPSQMLRESFDPTSSSEDDEDADDGVFMNEFLSEASADDANSRSPNESAYGVPGRNHASLFDELCDAKGDEEEEMEVADCTLTADVTVEVEVEEPASMLNTTAVEVSEQTEVKVEGQCEYTNEYVVDKTASNNILSPHDNEESHTSTEQELLTEQQTPEHLKLNDKQNYETSLSVNERTEDAMKDIKSTESDKRPIESSGYDSPPQLAAARSSKIPVPSSKTVLENDARRRNSSSSHKIHHDSIRQTCEQQCDDTSSDTKDNGMINKVADNVCTDDSKMAAGDTGNDEVTVKSTDREDTNVTTEYNLTAVAKQQHQAKPDLDVSKTTRLNTDQVFQEAALSQASSRVSAHASTMTAEVECHHVATSTTAVTQRTVFTTTDVIQRNVATVTDSKNVVNTSTNTDGESLPVASNANNSLSNKLQREKQRQGKVACKNAEAQTVATYGNNEAGSSSARRTTPEISERILALPEGVDRWRELAYSCVTSDKMARVFQESLACAVVEADALKEAFSTTSQQIVEENEKLRRQLAESQVRAQEEADEMLVSFSRQKIELADDNERLRRELLELTRSTETSSMARAENATLHKRLAECQQQLVVAETALGEVNFETQSIIRRIDAIQDAISHWTRIRQWGGNPPAFLANHDLDANELKNNDDSFFVDKDLTARLDTSSVIARLTSADTRLADIDSFIRSLAKDCSSKGSQTDESQRNPYQWLEESLLSSQLEVLKNKAFGSSDTESEKRKSNLQRLALTLGADAKLLQNGFPLNDAILPPFSNASANNVGVGLTPSVLDLAKTDIPQTDQSQLSKPMGVEPATNQNGTVHEDIMRQSELVLQLVGLNELGNTATIVSWRDVRQSILTQLRGEDEPITASVSNTKRFADNLELTDNPQHSRPSSPTFQTNNKSSGNSKIQRSPSTRKADNKVGRFTGERDPKKLAQEYEASRKERAKLLLEAFIGKPEPTLRAINNANLQLHGNNQDQHAINPVQRNLENECHVSRAYPSDIDNLNFNSVITRDTEVIKPTNNTGYDEGFDCHQSLASSCLDSREGFERHSSRNANYKPRHADVVESALYYESTDYSETEEEYRKRASFVHGITHHGNERVSRSRRTRDDGKDFSDRRTSSRSNSRERLPVDISSHSRSREHLMDTQNNDYYDTAAAAVRGSSPSRTSKRIVHQAEREREGLDCDRQQQMVHSQWREFQSHKYDVKPNRAVDEKAIIGSNRTQGLLHMYEQQRSSQQLDRIHNVSAASSHVNNSSHQLFNSDNDLSKISMLSDAVETCLHREHNLDKRGRQRTRRENNLDLDISSIADKDNSAENYLLYEAEGRSSHSPRTGSHRRADSVINRRNDSVVRLTANDKKEEKSLVMRDVEQENVVPTYSKRSTTEKRPSSPIRRGDTKAEKRLAGVVAGERHDRILKEEKQPQVTFAESSKRNSSPTRRSEEFSNAVPSGRHEEKTVVETSQPGDDRMRSNPKLETNAGQGQTQQQQRTKVKVYRHDFEQAPALTPEEKRKLDSIMKKTDQDYRLKREELRSASPLRVEHSLTEENIVQTSEPIVTTKKKKTDEDHKLKREDQRSASPSRVEHNALEEKKFNTERSVKSVMKSPTRAEPTSPEPKVTKRSVNSSPGRSRVRQPSGSRTERYQSPTRSSEAKAKPNIRASKEEALNRSRSKNDKLNKSTTNLKNNESFNSTFASEETAKAANLTYDIDVNDEFESMRQALLASVLKESIKPVSINAEKEAVKIKLDKTSRSSVQDRRSRHEDSVSVASSDGELFITRSGDIVKRHGGLAAKDSGRPEYRKEIEEQIRDTNPDRARSNVEVEDCKDKMTNVKDPKQQSSSKHDRESISPDLATKNALNNSRGESAKKSSAIAAILQRQRQESIADKHYAVQSEKKSTKIENQSSTRSQNQDNAKPSMTVPLCENIEVREDIKNSPPVKDSEEQKSTSRAKKPHLTLEQQKYADNIVDRYLLLWQQEEMALPALSTNNSISEVA